MKTHFVTLLFISLGLAGTALAAPVSHADKAFFDDAAKSGAAEVAISQGAMTHLSTPALKDFAKMMVDDHTKANSELITLASQKGVTLPETDKKAADLTEDWSKKTGDVDKDYAKKMVKDHKEAVELFQKASRSKDSDIAAFATKTLPTLQQHLERIEQLSATTNK